MNKAPNLQTYPDSVPKPQLAAFLKLSSRFDWEVTCIDELGLHLRKKRTYGSGYLLIGALTAIIGIGLLVWLIGLFDFLAKSDRILFIPHQDLANDAISKAADLLL